MSDSATAEAVEKAREIEEDGVLRADKRNMEARHFDAIVPWGRFSCGLGKLR